MRNCFRRWLISFLRGLFQTTKNMGLLKDSTLTPKAFLGRPLGLRPQHALPIWRACLDGLYRTWYTHPRSPSPSTRNRDQTQDESERMLLVSSRSCSGKDVFPLLPLRELALSNTSTTQPKASLFYTVCHFLPA